MSLVVGSYGTVAVQIAVRRSKTSLVDFNDATAATVAVQWPKLTLDPDEGRVVREWTPTLDVQNAAFARLLYTLQDGDIPRVGAYGIAVTLDTPFGPIQCEPTSLQVIDQF